MKNYFDESGRFGWTPEATSVFCGLSIDRSLPKIVHDFCIWREKIAQVRAGDEVKGGALTEQQLTVFVKWVVLPHRDFYVTVVGADTRVTQEAVVRQWIDQAAPMCEAASRFEQNRSNPTPARQYHTMAKWLRKRSPQNGLWMATLPRSILRRIQQTIVRYIDEADDPEYEEWDILIDRSFIHTTKHEMFWGAWLRNLLYQLTNQNPVDVPEDWLKRNHPHVRKSVPMGASQVFRECVRAVQASHPRRRFEGPRRAADGGRLRDDCAPISRGWLAGTLLAPVTAHFS